MGEHGIVVAPTERRAPHGVPSSILACPRCHAGPLNLSDDAFGCPSCDFRGAYKNGVYLTMDDRSASYFDELHGTMTEQSSKEGVYEVFYAQQFAYLESILRPGMTLLDVGCGPTVGYRRPQPTLLVGIDPSYRSIVVNMAVDVRIFGTAQALPVATASVDVLVCSYSIHHMIGASIAEARQNVCGAFEEFKRVVKPGGKVVVFEVIPYWPFWIAEQLVWRLARRSFGKAIDFYFWSSRAMERLGQRYLGAKKAESERYRADWKTIFPPAFSIQWLRMPFLLYPFHVVRYTWTL